MALKFYNLCLLLFLLSCSLPFDKEIVNHGSDLKSLNKINIVEGETSKSFILKNLGPPSFVNPYDNKNVYYIFHQMIKEIGKVNQFQEAQFLEISYNENDKVVEFNYKEENLTNKISLSELDEKSIAEDRTTFEILRNIFSNLRQKNVD